MCSNLIRPSGDTRFVMTWMTWMTCDHQIWLAKGRMTATEYQRMVGATDRMPLIRRIWFKKIVFTNLQFTGIRLFEGIRPLNHHVGTSPLSSIVLFKHVASQSCLYIYIYVCAHYVIILSPQIQTKTSQWLSHQSLFLQHSEMRQHVSVVSGTFLRHRT